MGKRVAYNPEVRTTRLDYRKSKLWFTLVNAESLDQVTDAFRRNREQGMSERLSGRWLPNQTRKAATLQVSRWTFQQPPSRNRRIFVVITRQDSAWSVDRDDAEPYSIAVVLDDREQENVNLYAEIRTLLQARARVRARVRV